MVFNTFEDISGFKTLTERLSIEMPLKINIFKPWTLLCMDTAHIIVYLHMKISPSSVSWLNRFRLPYSNVDCTGQLWLMQDNKHKGDKWKLPKVIKFPLLESPTSHFLMSFTHPRKKAAKQVGSSLASCLFLYKKIDDSLTCKNDKGLVRARRRRNHRPKGSRRCYLRHCSDIVLRTTLTKQKGIHILFGFQRTLLHSSP